MKLCIAHLLNIALVVASVATLANAECGGLPQDDERCLPVHEPCTHDPEACCDGTGCFGYNFFKRCKKPPACLDKWEDCSSGMDCCGDMVCAITNVGAHECQVKTIKTVVATFKSTNETESDAAPTQSPTSEVNIRTTKVPGPVYTKVGCSVGDPHIYTFDGLAHDCQAEGEFVLLKSTVTQRQIQARFAHFADRFSEGSAWSVTRGVAIQDEGDTPSVQLNIPVLESSLAPNKIGPNHCPMQFFVDGVQRDLDEGAGQEDKVLVTQQGRDAVEVFYVESEMKVTVTTGFANGCFINVCVYLPETDTTTIGLLGNTDGDVWNDWMTTDNEPLPVPVSLMERMQFPGYDYCTKNWCLRDETDSIFTYAENGVEFQDIMHCDLPFGNTLEEMLLKTDAATLQFCGEEMMCILDAEMGGLDAARQTKNARLPVQATCNKAGGECNVASCCDELKCVEIGLAKECAVKEPVCVSEWGNCEAKGCCDDLLCEELQGGMSQCRSVPECMPEWRDCSQIDCCGDMHCVEHGDGFHQCRDLPECMPEWEDCSFGVGCCGDLTCVLDDHTGSHQCRDVPTCHDSEYRECHDIPCCGGLTCIEESDGRQVCQQLPSCVYEWNSCKYGVGCCQDGDKPLACVDFVDEHGRAASQCQTTCASNWGICSDDKPCCDSSYECVHEPWGSQCKPKN